MSTTQTKSFRYQLPAKAIKGDCPECGPRHRRTLSRYIDTQTSEPLPDTYGRCDRESNCGYHLSPYHRGASGLSYHNEVNNMDRIGPIPKTWFRMAGNLKRKGHIMREGVVSQLIEMEGATPEQAEKVAAFIFDKAAAQSAKSKPAPVIYSIPDEVFRASLGHYERNQFARLLRKHLGDDTANELLNRFQIGTSSRWSGSCVFWYIDEKGHKRGGQIKLFDDDFHTAKYVDHTGEKRSKTSWVHSALARRLDKKKQPYPDWLTAYLDEQNAVEKSPCLFGLPQLESAPVDQPIAIVEAPKTAVLCSAYFPDFVWLAVGALSYLTIERLLPLKGRRIMLFPDLSKGSSAFTRWSQIAEQLRPKGFQISVSNLLEESATEKQREQGLDLADFLLDQELAKPLPSRLKIVPNEVLAVEPCDTYPADWDEPAPKAFIPPATRIAHPKAPLAFDAAEQLRRIQWVVITDEAVPEHTPPTLAASPNRDAFAQMLGLTPDELPLYQLHTQS